MSLGRTAAGAPPAALLFAAAAAGFYFDRRLSADASVSCGVDQLVNAMRLNFTVDMYANPGVVCGAGEYSN